MKFFELLLETENFDYVHRLNAKYHFKKRASERYRLEINDEIYNLILQHLKTKGEYTRLERQGPDKEVSLVCLKNPRIDLVVVYDRKNNILFSALPYNEYLEKHKDFKKNRTFRDVLISYQFKQHLQKNYRLVFNNYLLTTILGCMSDPRQHTLLQRDKNKEIYKVFVGNFTPLIIIYDPTTNTLVDAPLENEII